MLNRRIALCLLAAFTIAGAAPAPLKARDWFVRAGSSGDGSREKPFGDPWEALEKCEAGDAIHVAAGKYFGKMGDAQWKIPFDKVQLIGGYNAGFTERDPWKHHAELLWSKESKNWPLEARVQSPARDVVIDGFVIDMKEQNSYDGAMTGRTGKPGQAAVYLWLPSTVRNCVFVNPGAEAVVCRNGSTVENNLFVNALDSGLKVLGLPSANPDSKVPAVVKGNTFAWFWCDRAPGSGRYSGAAIHMTGHATISNNIFAHCDNNAIYCTINPEKSSITNNVFSMNLWSNLKMFVDGGDRVVDDKSMDLLEEVGLKAFEGNVVANPQLPLDPEWMDMTTKRTAAQPGKLVMDDWNKLRQALGLDLKGEGGKAASGIAPPYPLDKALALMAPKNAAIKAGARVVKLEAKFTGAVGGAPEKTYERVELAAFKAEPKKYDGKPIELLIGIGGVANISGLPEAYKKDDHEGVSAYDPAGGQYVIAFFRKGTSAQRVMSEVGGWFGGSGKPERLYAIRGTAHASEGFHKAWIFVESAAKHERAASARARAKGRDWFVRAGASGGDGSREKPFRDPFQPLERCEAGDTIHVALGEYVGKLRAGVWKVDTTDIALLGGYDAEFKERDPWKNLTVLNCPADYKGRRGGYTLEGDGDHTGMVVDGFVFDKRLNNKYAANGDLMVMESDKTEHLWVARPDCVVRNCVFLNGAMGALRASAGQLIENNIFMNHNGQSVELQAGHTTAATVVRNNTFLFVWDKKFGSSETRQGTHLILGTRVNVVVDSNVFQFADNHAIRLNVDEKDADLVNNVFSHNLWSIVDRPRDFKTVDDKTIGQLKDLGWRKCEGNQVLVPNIPVDEKWFSVYLNRTAYVPGKVVMDDWNKLREMLGQPVLATGGKPAEGYAPVYERAAAAALFPKNDACKAGARPVKLEAKFEGIERKEESNEYAEVKWDDTKNREAWDKLDGKRVWLKVAIKSTDNQYQLGDVKEGEYQAFHVGGEQGSDSGLPMRCYVKRGTRHERMMKQSKGYASGKPEEYHIIKGIARQNRQVVVEVIEKAE